MTIKARLWLMAFVSIAGLLAVFGTGKTGIDSCQVSFDKVVDDRLPKIISLEKLIINSVRIQRDVRELVLVKDAARREAINKRIDEQRTENAKLYDYLDKTITSAKGKQLLEEAQRHRRIVVDLNKTIQSLIRDGKDDEAIQLITSIEARDKGQGLRSAMQAFVDYQKEVTATSAKEGKENTQSANQWMLIISVLAIGIVIGIALMVIRAVSGAITEIVSGVAKVVSSMSFKTRLPARQDELNQVSEALNSMVASLERAVSDSNAVIGAIAAGDFSQRITNTYVGDLDALKQGINGSADNIAHVMTELSASMHALREGQFGQKLSTNAPGQYGQMLSSASQSMQSINGVIQSLNVVMTKMSEGMFTERVNVEARGDLLTMKTMVNASMDQIELAMKNITQIVLLQAQGDLTRECTAQFSGQLEETKNALNATSRRLKEIVSQAVSASSIVNDAAGQVSQGSADLSARVQEQASALEQTSATMHEMTSAVQANTANARKVADLTNQVQNQAKDGVQVMQQTISAMQSIKESSSKINDIVTIIDSIAFQTNLLALNAAVEAARAGEHGRGFAVVASEVRALAGKSADAAKDIKNLITDSVSRIENGTHLADKSGEMLNGIATSIQHVAGMIDEIATASNEQSVGISQVHLAIADIDKVTQENAALVEETTAAAESLSTEANNLRSNMAFFKTGSGSAEPSRSAPNRPATERSRSVALPAPKKASVTKSDEWGEF